MHEFLRELGIDAEQSGVLVAGNSDASGPIIDSVSPVDGAVIATIKTGSEDDYDRAVVAAEKAFLSWREVPAPVRGEIVRQIGLSLREHKRALGLLVSLEMGKIATEGEGEVQEMIDIADFAVGLSRQLYGLDIKSERARHRMAEQWHPLGAIGIISAFNFPVAVWAWNAFIAAICGDTMIWKPSSKTPLCAIAVQRIASRVLKEHGYDGVMNLVVGSARTVGERMIGDPRMKLISATGSTRMGRRIGEVVASRFGKSILELGGNNAVVVMPDADIDMALRAVLFGAVGTAGQRCTSTRRLLLHRDIADDFVARLQKSYANVRIGSPLHADTLMGPLIDHDAVATMKDAMKAIGEQGGEILCGGAVLDGPDFQSGCYVEPVIVRVPGDKLDSFAIMRDETFAPILYVVEVDDLSQAIAIQNGVDQGLSSAIFTDSVRSAERFLSAVGSDCGIANVNIGTSGAEIGGAFGGEKETGGGRESGSDSWKAYMRRQTQTINWSTELPLAQGVDFG